MGIQPKPTTTIDYGDGRKYVKKPTEKVQPASIKPQPTNQSPTVDDETQKLIQ